MNQPQEPQRPRALTAQQLVILVVIGFGFVGGAILYKFDWASIIIAIFLGTGVASLVYGFLGGIESTTFNLGPVKMGGSIAILIRRQACGSRWRRAGGSQSQSGFLGSGIRSRRPREMSSAPID